MHPFFHSKLAKELASELDVDSEAANIHFLRPRKKQVIFLQNKGYIYPIQDPEERYRKEFFNFLTDSVIVSL